MVLIEDILEVPRDCVADIVVPKKEVFEADDSNTKDKKIFTDIVKQILLCYNFSEENIRVEKYIDEIRSYENVVLFNIKLKYDNVHKIGAGKFKEDDKIDRVANVVMRSIPYPMILTMQYENELKFYGAHIRDSRADFDKIVIDGDMHSTNWMDIYNLSEIEEDFISKIQLDYLDKTDLYDFYDSYITSIIQHDGATTVNGIVDLPVEEIKRINAEISTLERKVREIEKEIDEETNFNRKMDLNIKAHESKIEIEKLKNELRSE